MAELTELASEGEDERLVIDSELSLVCVIGVDVSAYRVGVGQAFACEGGHVEGKGELESGVSSRLERVSYSSVLPVFTPNVKGKTVDPMRCRKIDALTRYSATTPDARNGA